MLMNEWKLPPKAKVYEALSALADGRVEIVEPGKAKVTSSSRDKVYDVTWSGEREITSNDNASFWQGYIGYPIIAVLLSTGRLHVDHAIASSLKGIPWKKLNTKFKRDYDAVVHHVLSGIDANGGDSSEIVSAVERIFSELSMMHLAAGEQRKRPPITR
jgi:hypothetical protein